MAIWASSRGRQERDRRSQSFAVGVRCWGSDSERGADFGQAQAHLLGDADERDPADRVARVAALAPRGPVGVDQALGLVEPERRRRDAGAVAQLADGQLVVHREQR